MSTLRERCVIVWAGLMVLTCVTTWGLSKDSFDPMPATVGTFSIAALKVRYVMLDFMELRHAPVWVRGAFQAWIALVLVVFLGFWLLTPSITGAPAVATNPTDY